MVMAVVIVVVLVVVALVIDVVVVMVVVVIDVVVVALVIDVVVVMVLMLKDLFSIVQFLGQGLGAVRPVAERIYRTWSKIFITWVGGGPVIYHSCLLRSTRDI